MIKLGEYNKLKVIRKSDLGYMLSDGSEEVLLHFSQSVCEHKDDEELNVFIYADKKERLTATELKPTATIIDAGFAKVVDVIPSVGVFVNINTPKDVLISKDNLPYDESLWPQVDDLLFIRLKIRKNSLVGKPLNRFDIISLHKKVTYLEQEQVKAHVCKIAEKGISLITNDLMYVYVPETQLRGKYRLGEEVLVTITKELDEEYYGTLNKHKELLMDTDRELILEYMNNHAGSMPLTAKSSSEDVLKYLKMSRKAFKRAYGGLYKDHIIDFDDNKTFIVKK